MRCQELRGCILFTIFLRRPRYRWPCPELPINVKACISCIALNNFGKWSVKEVRANGLVELLSVKIAPSIELPFFIQSTWVFATAYLFEIYILCGYNHLWPRDILLSFKTQAKLSFVIEAARKDLARHGQEAGMKGSTRNLPDLFIMVSQSDHNWPVFLWRYETDS